MWWDYSVQPGDKVRYSVIPVVGSRAQGTLKVATDQASAKSAELTVAGQDGRSISGYLSRGIIASQRVAKELAAEERTNRSTGPC